MKVIVITGSTRGIGYGLADSFLTQGCKVIISGRTLENVERAITKLSSDHNTNDIHGHPCDVTQFEQVQGLWEAAKSRCGKIDIWINNAGIAHPQTDFWVYTPEQMKTVVETNLLGAMNGARVALCGMLEQGFGSLYNMEGLGSDGRKVAGLTLYGSTKAGINYLTDALTKEMKGTPIVVGALRPGMVVTDMIIHQYKEGSEEWERAKRIFNILADRVETVTPWLAERVLANNKTGVRINWMSRGKLAGRFLATPFRKRDLFG